MAGPAIPTPKETSPLRVLAAIACVTVTIAALAVAVLAVKAIGTVDRLDREVSSAAGQLRDAAGDLSQAADRAQTP